MEYFRETVFSVSGYSQLLPVLLGDEFEAVRGSIFDHQPLGNGLFNRR